MLLFLTNDCDQRPLPGDGASPGQRTAAAQRESGKQLWQQQPAEDHGERAQEAGQQDAL